MPRRIRISRLQNLTLVAESGLFAWAGFNASFVRTTVRTLVALKGTFSWTGFNATLTKQRFYLQATSGVFGIIGRSATFTYTPVSVLGWANAGNIFPISIQQGGFYDLSPLITGNLAQVGAITAGVALPTGVSITSSPTWRIVAGAGATVGVTAGESLTIVPAASQLNIVNFGAIGNGTTNNIVAINNTLAQAKLIGASVLIPAGTFAYNGVINNDSVTMIGVGDTSILYAQDTANETIMCTGTAPKVQSMQLSGVTPPSRLTTLQCSRVTINGATNFLVDSVLINTSAGAGVMDYGGSNGSITNNRINNTKADSIHNTHGASFITITGNVITNSGDDGIAVVSYSNESICHDITASNNNISNNVGGRGMSVVGGQDVFYEQNTITNTGTKAGMLVAQEAGTSPTLSCLRITYQFNTVSNCGSSTTGHSAIFINDSNLAPNTTIRITRNDILQTQLGQSGLRVDSGQNVDIIFDQNRINGATTNVFNQCTPPATVNNYVSGPVGVSSTPPTLPALPYSPNSVFGQVEPNLPPSMGVSFTPSTVLTFGGTIRLAQATDPGNSGVPVYIHRILKSDAAIVSGHSTTAVRSERMFNHAPESYVFLGQEFWCCFAIRTISGEQPTTGLGDGTSLHLVWQTHTQGSGNTLPPLALFHDHGGNRRFITRSWNTFPESTWQVNGGPNLDTEGHVNVTIGTYPTPNVWYKYIVHMRSGITTAQAPITEVWEAVGDNIYTKVVNHVATTDFNDYNTASQAVPTGGTYNRIGLYKYNGSSWDAGSGTTSIAMYATEIYQRTNTGAANYFNDCVTTLTPFGTSAAATDWANRISGAGVVWYHNFDTATEVNQFRWSGSTASFPNGGSDPIGAGPDAANCTWISSGGADGGGFLRLIYPLGSNSAGSYWWRPYNALTGAGNGRGVNDPGANGTIVPVGYNPSGGAQPLYNWGLQPNPGWYMSTVEQANFPGKFQGSDFWVQVRVRRAQTPGAPPDSAQYSSITGKSVWFTTTVGSYTLQEHVTYGQSATTHNVGQGTGDHVGQQSLHNVYNGQNFQSIGDNNQPNETLTLSNFNVVWKYSGGWDTLLYHFTPGSQNGTGANRTRFEVWAQHSLALFPAESGQYVKIWDATYTQSFDTNVNSGGSPGLPGWNALILAIYHNGSQFATSSFQYDYDQVIFSKATIPAPTT